jgi:hypothetical protein
MCIRKWNLHIFFLEGTGILNKVGLYKKETYLVETNLFVQTMETLIEVTRSWSKGELMRGGRSDLQNSWEVGEVIYKGAFANYSSHLLNAPLDQHRVAQIEVSIVYTERLVSTWYVAF